MLQLQESDTSDLREILSGSPVQQGKNSLVGVISKPDVLSRVDGVPPVNKVVSETSSAAELISIKEDRKAESYNQRYYSRTSVSFTYS